MPKIITQNSEYKTKIKKGIDIVYDLISGTLGPQGQSVALDRGFKGPILADDGVSIAKAIEVNDDTERNGMEMIKEVAEKTNEEAGDGTTTAVILAHALIEEGLKRPENPIFIRNSLNKALEKVLIELKKATKPIKTTKQILEIATLSANSEELGEQITRVFKSVGKEGIISVEEGKGAQTQVTKVDGYQIEKGFISSYMQTKEGKAEYEKVKVLVIGENIKNVYEIMPTLNRLLEKGIREFVLFCVEMDNSVLNTIILNRQQGIFKCLAVKANSQNNEILEDVALVTGATFISKEAGYKLEEIEPEMLGEAEKIIATKDKTIILNGKGKVGNKVRDLKAQLPEIKNENEYDLMEKRIARLNNSIAVISVGAKTETEMRDKYLKMEDAVNAVKSALEEGIVEGGGMTLYKISQTLSDDNVGEKIMKSILHAPLKKIIENCGKDYTDILLNMPKGKGYDAKNDCYVNLVEVGIIDPVKVERCCLENAVSFVGTFLNSKACVALKREDTKENE